jgi:superoxide reductase
MTGLSQVYKCHTCGNMVEVVHAGDGDLVCHGQPMELLSEKTREAGKEKHVPVIERTGTLVRVKVGSVPHVMEEKHYIEWIEVIADGRVYRKFLNPGEEPIAEFSVEARELTAREYCNLHGLWRS